MAKHRGIWPLRWLCEALDVSRGGYYTWLSRPLSAHARRDEELAAPIKRSFGDSDRTYGARRVRRDLRAWGYPCGIHRVERLMLAAGLEARRKRRRLPFDCGVRAADSIAENVLDRDFQALAPNQRWVADFTYIWTDEGWLYVAAVLDAYFAQGRPAFHGKTVHGFTPCRSSAREAGRSGLCLIDELRSMARRLPTGPRAGSLKPVRAGRWITGREAPDRSVLGVSGLSVAQRPPITCQERRSRLTPGLGYPRFSHFWLGSI